MKRAIKMTNRLMESESEFKTMTQILSEDGIVEYYGKILSQEEADRYLELLMEKTLWKNDEVVIFGRHIITKRQVAWYGDSDFLYSYSNTTKKAIPWTTELTALKQKVEQVTGTTFNSCLLNLYHNGEEGLGWHSDDEKELGERNTIASLSLGAPRRFLFKHKQTKNTVTVILEHGSLIVMKGDTQKNWLHSLPKTKNVTGPRINLTFRTFKRFTKEI
jgi:alkylated DNA repair dioxygenase AlkB